MLGQQQAILVEDIYSRGLIEMQNEKRWRQEGLVFRRRLGERIFKMCVDRPLIFGDGWRGGGHSPARGLYELRIHGMGAIRQTLRFWRQQSDESVVPGI